MKEDKIQTLHPEPGKKNEYISAEKYDAMKAAIYYVLRRTAPTYTELIKELKEHLKETFHDNVSWYTMVVKLDLEAKGMIERTKSKPQRYRITEIMG